jgi:hypothetical protein
VIVVALSQHQHDVIDASTAAAPDLTRESLAALREAFAEVAEDASDNDAA